MEEIRTTIRAIAKEEIATPAKRKHFFKKYFPIVLVILVVILALLSGYFYKKSKRSGDFTQVEIKNLIANVQKIAEVPTNETPTIATVSDPEALRNQPFFAGAKKGDKVLIYSVAKKAVLYDPVADKIINIAPLNVDTQKASATQQVPSVVKE